MKIILKKLTSFLIVCSLCAGLLFIIYKKVFDLNTESPQPKKPAIESEKKAAPLEHSRPMVAQQNNNIDRQPQKLKPQFDEAPSPARQAYDKLKSQQIIVSLLKDKFFATHRLWFPAQPDELYDVRQSQNPQAEHLHIHGPFGVYLIVISVFDKIRTYQVLDRELKAQDLFEDDLKILPAPRRRNTGFINEKYYELPGGGYQVMMIGQHRATKKTILLRFRTSTYNRHVGQFMQKKYRQIKVR